MKKYNNFLNEMIFDKIPTTSDSFITKSLIDGYDDYKFDFLTNKGSSYSVYILMTYEKNIIFVDNTNIENIVIPTLLFSETKNGLDPTYFNKLTNAKEFAEVMGKVIYIILDFINKHDFDIYSIGQVDNKKLNFYNHYKYHFENKFDIMTGSSTFYIDDNDNYTNAYYLKRK